MTVKLKINGSIIPNSYKEVYEYFGLEGTAPKDIENALPENDDVEITINSFGGSLSAGNEIYTSLMGFTGKVTIKVIMAGSAASLIAMAGDDVQMSPVGQIMIHNVSMYASGDYRDMDKASEILKKSNASLSNAYQLKTGKSREEILALMDEETWLTAEEAIEYGFADGEMFVEEEDKSLLVADLGSGLLSPEAVEKMRNEMENKKEESKDEEPKKESPFAKYIY